MTDAVETGTGTAPAPVTSAAVAEPAPGSSPSPTASASSTAPAVVEHTSVDSLLAKFDAEKAAAALDEPPKPAEPAPKPAEEPAKPAEAAKPAEEKPAEAKPAEPPKPDEAKPAEKTPEQIGAEAAEAARVEAERHDYTKLEIPKELVADDERMGQAIDLLKEWKVPVEAGKKLLDLHTSTLKEFAENVARHSLSEQHRIFGETRKKWTQEVLADPELGGAGHQTAMAQIAKVRDMMVPESERAKFGEFLAVTGAGDNPTFLRALYRASKFMNEPGMPPPNPAPVPGNGKSPNKRAVLYDHPTSQAGSRQ